MISPYENIAGVTFSTLGLQATVQRLSAWMDDEFSGARWFACVNPHSVELVHRTRAFARAIKRADIVTADGTGIVLVSRLNGGNVSERVCGPDIFPLLMEKLNRERPGTRVFFLGSTEETLQILRKKCEKDFPALEIAGVSSPPYKPSFSPLEIEMMASAINQTNSDILWIGLGAPKQEILTAELVPMVNVRIVGPIGGVFDFYSGRITLPPVFLQKFGLIWLYRLVQEPRRLWRRNIDAPVFVVRAFLTRLGLLRYGDGK